MKDTNRLEKIQQFGLKKGQEDPAIQLLIKAITYFYKVPIVYVSIIGEFEQFFKARIGIDVECTRREDAFCNMVVQQDDIVIIEDAKSDLRYVSNPMVSGPPYIRFYAGIPLKLNNITVGAVSIADTKKRILSASERLPLQYLSLHISSYLGLYKQKMSYEQEHQLIEHSPAVLFKWGNTQSKRLRVDYISGNLPNIFGLPLERFVINKASLEDFMDDNSTEAFHFAIDSHRRGERTFETQFELRNGAGKCFWVKMISTGFFDDNNGLEAIHALLLDQTHNRYTEQKLVETNQQMRLLLEASDLGTWDYDLVQDNISVNQCCCDMIGLPEGLLECSRLYWRSLIHPDDREMVASAYQDHLSGKTETLFVTYRIEHSEGDWLWIETYGRIVERGKQGEPIRLAGIHRDITSRKKIELLEDKQRQLLSFVNKATSYYLKNQDLDQACREILPELNDISDSELAFIAQMRQKGGRDVLLIHAINELSWNDETRLLVEKYHQGELFFTSLDNLFGSVIKTEQLVLTNHPQLHPASTGLPEGHPTIHRFMGLPIKLRGQTVGMIGLANKTENYTIEDADFLQPLTDALAGLYYSVDQEEARQKAEEKLKQLAMTDPLTGLLNRRAFKERLYEGYFVDKHCVLAILDIDHFKNVNDSYGHIMGDEVLKAIAYQLSDLLRTDDLFARLGGEEFAILMRSEDTQSMDTLLNSLREKVEELEIRCEEQTISVTVSIGAFKFINDDSDSLENLIAKADEALYEAKNSGRNCLKWAN